ncbi:hypothetical protein FS837_001642 [Tulasnella sp. UAMH 9824]|nr:hypothetical protein FS837_001642 [Tulasnella sp. UAMH 9824]
MATAKVTFATPPPSEPVESSLAASVETLEEISLSLAKARAVLESLAHLIIFPERLTFVDCTESDGALCDVYFAKLDETSHTPKDVTVERYRVDPKVDGFSKAVDRFARELEARNGLRHPNVLELLGYYLSPDHHTAQVISPYMTNGRLGEYLARPGSRVGIDQRLRFVRDITSGLDYLHSRKPPICHGDLRVKNIHVDGNLNAVLSCFGLASVQKDVDDPSGLTASVGLTGPLKYYPPEILLGEHARPNPESDVWAWGCTAFEILTSDLVFKHQNSNSAIFRAHLKRALPAPPERLLSLVPQAPKPEYASSLRFLHTHITRSWEYEPRNRPSISLVRQQAFVFSFESDAGNSVVASLEELAHLLIPTERLLLLERSLGSGNYGEVVLGILDETSPTPREVAVKRLKAVGTRGERVRLAKRLARELNIWAQIKHPNVVELIGWYLDEKYESPLLISALMPYGDVLKYIEASKPDIQQRIAFMKGITAGLACLHNLERAICHADMKPANVLIDLHLNAVLCDFGLASFVDSPIVPGLVTTTALKGGTPRYMSPELHLDDNCTHNLESDVWAWACTVFHVLTGTIPYAKYPKQVEFCMAIGRGQPPGDIAMLLPNNFEGVDSESARALEFLHSIIPICWKKSKHRPKMCNLLSQMSNLSGETVNATGQNEEVFSNGSRERTSPPEASQNTLGGSTDSGEGAQDAGWVIDLEDPAPKNLLKRKRADPDSSGYAHSDEDDRKVRARLEGSSGSDGRMRDEEEEDRDDCNALKAQLLALVAAIDERAQIRGSQAPHENSSRMPGIRKALGDQWDSQLATVLQDIDRHKTSGGATKKPSNSEEGRAS